MLLLQYMEKRRGARFGFFETVEGNEDVVAKLAIVFLLSIGFVFAGFGW